jgi:hypothetical protein
MTVFVRRNGQLIQGVQLRGTSVQVCCVTRRSAHAHYMMWLCAVCVTLFSYNRNC